MRDRGWRLALSPASADVLVVTGRADGEMTEIVEQHWDAMPGPRARGFAESADAVANVLDAAAVDLVDDGTQRTDADGRSGSASDDAARADDSTSHDGMDHDGMGHGGMDHGEMDHDGMDHGEMDMAPDGIPLAGASEHDRDGLEMDELPLRLGPILPAWPAGLVLDLVLHGDLVVAATGSFVPAGASTEAGAALLGARRCDDLAAMLDLAGWADGAARARRARDAALDGRDEVAATVLSGLRRRIERSRTMRWSLAGAGTVSAESAPGFDVPDWLVGDCRDRLLVLVDRARAAISNEGAHSADVSSAELVGPEMVAALVTGLDVGVARLVVASLGATAVREVVDV
ncbi:hypothetical protein [Phycicoccus mangrovi]|uniref:hypothetical protein n=1 Tax=Phycicoccus mangrovi TaxID=2840470 RepID=UPI001C00864A|nr:hypothetical protein [Phycicoccus mangrovi]MBT9254597.1 hypothetical protein [Phycicoccus mangrovi]